MADVTEEKIILLRDMNGNPLREGDLVMVILEKPLLVGFITELKEPSILTNRDKNPMGVMTVSGTIRLPFPPNQMHILKQTAKLVDPHSDALINALMNKSKEQREAAGMKLPDPPTLTPVAKPNGKEPEATTAPGPVLVTPAPVTDDPKD